MSLAAVNLNDRDAGVVDEIFGYITNNPPKNFFLFAGAGSGKTRTLVAVLRRLTGLDPLYRDVEFAKQLRARSQTIRVITYTKNAAQVITGRLGSNTLTDVATIHSFCWDLIKGFDGDIQEALLSMNAQATKEAIAAAEQRRNGPTEKDEITIAELRSKNESLRSTDFFTYSPDQNKFGDGALNHAQVLATAAWLLRERATLRAMLRDQHPLVLIDESQDTMKSILDALLFVADEEPSRLALGLFGDHRQRIYLDGHADLPSLIPPSWATPKLEMNHRSQRRIVDLINAIWDSDLEGRTQAKTGVLQQPRTEKSFGTVRLFIGDTHLASEEKVLSEAKCATAMQVATANHAWQTPSGFKTLALEHRLAARRGNFLEAYEAVALIDPDAVRPDADGESSGPKVIQVLLREMVELGGRVHDGKVMSEFAITELLQIYGRFDILSTDDALRGEQLDAYQKALEEFARISSNPKATVRDILAPVIRGNLFDVDQRLRTAFVDKTPPPPAPLPRQQESIESRLARGWHALFATPWAQIQRFKTYLKGESQLATHQVVKGSEYEHVMVVMDDEDAAGNLFSYDKLFGAPLSSSDVKNVTAQKETSIDRTLRLLYVTCSRAKESLALVLWAENPTEALAYARRSAWFLAGEVHEMPR